MTSRSMHVLALASALAAASVLASCTEPNVAIRSQRDGATSPIRRVKVYAPLVTGDDSNPVTPAMYDAFQASLVLRFQLCRVAAEVSPMPAPAASDAGHADTAPDHTLEIVIADRQVTKVHHVDQFGHEHATSYQGTMYFGLAIFDPRSPSPVWSARSSLKFVTGYNGRFLDPQEIDGTRASELARGIVAQLHRDGLLTGCIRETYVGCTADRLESRLRAERIPDERERIKAKRDLPDCK